MDYSLDLKNGEVDKIPMGLIAMREAVMTQEEMAHRVGFTQSGISRLERRPLRDWSVGNLYKYVTAIAEAADADK